MECPKCGKEMESGHRGDVCPNCDPDTRSVKTDPDGTVPAGGAPGESPASAPEFRDLADEGLPRIGPGWFISTWKNCLFAPGTFFSRLHPRTGYLRPLLFALVMDLIVAALLFLLAKARMARYTALILVTLPVISILVSLVAAFLFHVSLRILKGAGQGFATTLAVLFYSCAAHIFIPVPKVGNIVAMVWGLAVILIGLKSVHRTTWAKSVLALVLVPLLLFAALVLRWAVIAKL